MNEIDKIYIAGHNGMVGSAIRRNLIERLGYSEKQILCRSHKELDLTDQEKVSDFFIKERPTHVYLAAAKVGGIYANNTYPADFLYINLMIQANVIHSAFQSGVKNLLFLGSSCIYPKHAVQPMPEEALLTGPLEPTNEPYALAKIAGIKLCESYNRQYGLSHGIDYRSVMPSNLYGIGDNYHPENSHVIPALIRRIHEAKLNNSPNVLIWGTGRPFREFLYVDDMAEACIFVMNLAPDIYKSQTKEMVSHINVGYGSDVSIAELVKTISRVVGFKGKIEFDHTKPDGTAKKLMDSTKLIRMGWKPTIDLETGLNRAYKDFMARHENIKID